MRKVSVILGVRDDRVVPAQAINIICDVLKDFRDIRLEFAVVREAPSRALDMVGDEFVVLFDADGCYDPADVRKVLLPLIEGRADLVLGNRRLPSAVVSVRDRVANSFLTWLAGHLFRVPVEDSQTGLRAFRRAALGLQVPALRFLEVPVSYSQPGVQS